MSMQIHTLNRSDFANETQHLLEETGHNNKYQRPRSKLLLEYRRKHYGGHNIPSVAFKRPNLSKKINSVLSFKLWEGHIKQVEGHFGTAVASYFVLLRWLFYMNLVILVVWTLFVLIPQFVVEPSLRKQYFPCIHRNDSRNCTRNTTVYLVIGNCTTPPPHGLTVATLCSNPVTKVLTAPRAAKNTSTCPLGPGEWYQCPAYKPSFISPVDLVTGRGGYNDTALFLGHYVNFTVYNGISYNRPVAILVSTAVVFGVSIIMLMIKLVQSCMVVCLNKSTETYFCNRVFGSWDFNVVDAHTVKLRKTCIRKILKEELAEHEAHLSSRTPKEILQIVLIRTVTNLFVILLLVGMAAAIIAAAIYSWKQLVLQATSAKGLLVPIVVIFSIIVLPIVFHAVAHFEKYKTHGERVTMTLIRSAVVRIATLIVYIFSAYAAVQCTQDNDLQIKEFSVTVRSRIVCIPCWETFFGQQCYQLLLLEFLFIALFTVVLETVRNLAHKAFYKKLQNSKCQVIFSKPSFVLSDSILDLVYFQLLLWFISGTGNK
eukprot:Em0017g360a